MGFSLLLASAAAGSFSRAIVHPLDTLRSRLMISSAKNSGLLNAFKEVVRTDGFRGLYRGFAVSVIIQAPAVATYLTTYDYSKKKIRERYNVSPHSPLLHLNCGLIAEFFSCVFWVPMEVIKQRAQVRSGEVAAATTKIVTRDLLAHEGPRGLFKGFWLTMGVFGPYAMIYWAAYERLKRLTIASNDENGSMNFRAVATSASLAGGIAAGCTTPLDVIKTRLQTQDDIATKNSKSYSGSWDACRAIAREEGVRGFLRGLSARVLWMIPGTAITMSGFEYLKFKFQLASET